MHRELWWDSLLVVTFHGILMLLLFLLLFFAGPVIAALLEGLAGTLPYSMRQIISASYCVVRFALLCLVAIMAFLWFDAKIYQWFCVSHGKKSGTIYATSFSIVLFGAIVWFGILFFDSVAVIGENWHQTWSVNLEIDRTPSEENVLTPRYLEECDADYSASPPN